MRSRRGLPLAAVILLLGAVLIVLAVLAVTALPAVLALGLAVLALVAGVGARLHRRPGRRAHPSPAPPGVGDEGPVAEPDGSPLRWTVRWESWPSVDVLPGTREQVAVVLAEWGLTGEEVEPTLVVVTELLSNAIEHGSGAEWLSLAVADDTVRVRVRDHAAEQPTLRSPDPSHVRGRGLQVVEALSSRWGWTADPPGKVVWADVPTRWPA